MFPKAIRARLDRARASSDPAAALEAAARELKAEVGQYALFRLLDEYQGGLDWEDLGSVDGLIDLAWGAPWAPGRPLFERPLVEEADRAAGDRHYSVHEVVADLKRLDGRPVRVAGRLWLGFEISALWHTPESEQRGGDRSALALGGGVHRWLRMREYQGRPVTGAPPSSDARGVALWLSDEFCDRPVVVTAFVDARHRGHLACRPGGVYVVTMARA
jgi:hypothetical protein